MLVFLPLAALLGLGLYLRLSSATNALFYEDDYATAYQTMGIMDTWKPMWPSGWVQWGEPIALPYFMSVIWRVTGPDIMVGRYFSVAVGTLSILVAYLLGRRLRGETVGLVFAFLLATNLWSITASTFFRSYALVELAFLAICYLAVTWLGDPRSLKSYLLVLGASTAFILIGHYFLLIVLPVVILLPLIAKLSATVSERVQVEPLEQNQGHVRQGAQLHVRVDTALIVLLLSLALVFGLGTWVLFEHGILLAKAVGHVTGEFFEVLPAEAAITFKLFFVESFQKLYGSWILALIGLGAVIMLAQTGRRGLAILLYFSVPFVVFSTLFASFTVTDMFDRYMFPFNTAALLALAFFLAWLGQGMAEEFGQILPSAFRQGAVAMTRVAPALLVLGLALQSDAFQLQFDPTTTRASVESWIRGRGEPQTPSYHRVAMYIKERVTPDDVVLSTRGWELPFELPDTSAYWVIDNPVELGEGSIETEDGFRNRYTGHPAITNLGELMNLIAQGNSGWILLPYFHDNTGSLTPGIYSFVHAQMSLVPEASDSTMKVFRFEPDNFQTVPVAQIPEPYGNTYQVLSLANDATLFRGQPGTTNWAGIEYPLSEFLSIREVVFDVRIRVDKISGGELSKVDLVLEENDGDRWHVPGYLAIESGDQWQRFFVGFSNLEFWALGNAVEEPERITSIKVEVVNAHDLTFTAQVKVNLVTAKRSDG